TSVWRKRSSGSLPQENPTRSWEALNRSITHSAITLLVFGQGSAQRLVRGRRLVEERQEEVAVPVGQRCGFGFREPEVVLGDVGLADAQFPIAHALDDHRGVRKIVGQADAGVTICLPDFRRGT